jgi:hypothetical protein
MRMRTTQNPTTQRGAFLRETARKTNGLLKSCLTGLLGLAAVGTTAAQSSVGVSPYAFGINYTQSNLNTGKLNDLKTAGLTVVRLGGNARNNETPWDNKYSWVNDIEYVKYTLNAEPIIQLPIGLPTTDVDDWVYFFNVTKGYNIKYWTIGNEPEPGGTFADVQAWVNGAPFDQHATNGRANSLTNNFNYGQWEARFVALANALKSYDNTAKIIGPDFRLFYTQAIDLEYARFIANVGHQACASNANLPLLDVFSFHYYSYRGDAESVLKPLFDKVQGFITTANDQRPAAWSRLRLALTEVNGSVTTPTRTSSSQPWYFNAGQFVAIMTKLALANGAFCVTPWSVYESNGCRCGTDFSAYNSDDSRRSTLTHFALLSENRRANYMPGTQLNPTDQLVFIGMREQNTANAGYTIMLSNRWSTARSFNITLDNVYRGSSADAQITFNGYAGVTANPLVGSIPANTTFVFRCNASGVFVDKLIYSEADASANAKPHFRTALANTTSTLDEGLNIFPNPAQDVLNVHINADAGQATLTDLTGRVCLTQALTRTSQLNLQGLARGLYTLTVATPTGPTHQKIEKQ